MAGHIATSKRTDWCTPAGPLDIARETFRGPIGFDPCGNVDSIVRARREIRFGRQHEDGLLYVREQGAETAVAIGDGLVAPWGREQGFVNPPFGTVHIHRETLRIVEADEWKTIPEEERGAYDKKTLGDWIAKVRAEHEAYGFEGCLLIPAAVDTAPWQDDVWPAASAVGFFRGRLRFLGAEAHAPMACALVYFGHRPQRFEQAFNAAGKVVRP
jgi:hypothetical protein